MPYSAVNRGVLRPGNGRDVFTYDEGVTLAAMQANGYFNGMLAELNRMPNKRAQIIVSGTNGTEVRTLYIQNGQVRSR